MLKLIGGIRATPAYQGDAIIVQSQARARVSLYTRMCTHDHCVVSCGAQWVTPLLMARDILCAHMPGLRDDMICGSTPARKRQMICVRVRHSARPHARALSRGSAAALPVLTRDRARRVGSCSGGRRGGTSSVTQNGDGNDADARAARD